MRHQEKMSKPDLDHRLDEILKQHGKKWKEIARMLNEEGYRNRKNEPFTSVAIRQRWNRVTALRATIFRLDGTDWTSETRNWFIPPEKADFCQAMAAALLLGTYLEQAGKYFRRLALHHTNDQFDELGLALLGATHGFGNFRDRQDEKDDVLAVRRMVFKMEKQLSELPGMDQDWIGSEFVRPWLNLFSGGIGNIVHKRSYASFRRYCGLEADNDNPELSPKPTRKKQNGKELKSRLNIGGTIDPVLKELFDLQRKRLGIPAARLIDTILWHWYGWPALSHEDEHEVANVAISVREESCDSGSATISLALLPMVGSWLRPNDWTNLLSLMGFSEEDIGDPRDWLPHVVESDEEDDLQSEDNGGYEEALSDKVNEMISDDQALGLANQSLSFADITDDS